MEFKKKSTKIAFIICFNKIKFRGHTVIMPHTKFLIQMTHYHGITLEKFFRQGCFLGKGNLLDHIKQEKLQNKEQFKNV